MPGFSDYEPSTNTQNLQEKRKKTIEDILGNDVINNKELIKPEMSEEEMEKNRTEQEKRQAKISNLKDMITSELLSVGYIEETAEFKEQFHIMWQKGIKELSQQDTQQEKKPCSSCEKKRKIREEIIKELRQQGLKEDFQNPEYKEKFTSIFQEKMKNNQV
jgi:hypothetical protein